MTTRSLRPPLVESGAIDRIALAHDYLTQRGGAERVVLSLVRAFPHAPLYTSFYEPAGTFPEFAPVDVRTSPLNLVAPLRRRHRLALPLLASAFSRVRIAADVAICSSSGWAHGAHVDGRKVVYCHAPARWLYQTSRYLGERGVLQRAAVASLRVPRLLPYKNVDAVVAAFARLSKELFVIVGDGPDEARLRAAASPNVHFA